MLLWRSAVVRDSMIAPARSARRAACSAGGRRLEQRREQARSTPAHRVLHLAGPRPSPTHATARWASERAGHEVVVASGAEGAACRRGRSVRVAPSRTQVPRRRSRYGRHPPQAGHGDGHRRHVRRSCAVAGGRRPDRRRIAELNEPMVMGKSRPVAKMVDEQLSPGRRNRLPLGWSCGEE